MKEADDLLRSGMSASEILRQLPLEALDEAMASLKRSKPADEVCEALEARIAAAPLAQFQALSAVYRKHCDSLGGPLGRDDSGAAGER